MKLYFEAFNRRPARQHVTLAQGSPKPKGKNFLPYTVKAVNRSRQDIKSWNDDLGMYLAEEPKNYPIQLLFNDITIDAHLTSQIENRKQQVFSIDFSLKKANGEKDEDQTTLLKSMSAYRIITNEMLDSRFFGYSVIELDFMKATTGTNALEVKKVPRTNLVPQLGRFYKDYTEDAFTLYREMREYGTWVLEFNTGDVGLLNKAVPHVLFKRFAQSCWSELCEIYGIPPRVMKTNTQDKVLLGRAEQMMRDMGAAAWFIIDETEEFEWAQGVSTNGDVYANLMTACRNEISLLISGAVIGQDTVNGNRSKDESAQEMLWQLVQSDMAMLEDYWNNIAIPALVKIGVLKGDLRFEFEPVEDLDQLWKITSGALTYYHIDAKWVKGKFGIEITGERNAAGSGDNQLQIGSDFFV